MFAPVRRLGVVVVDEEHDSSFKQEEGLRYSGRDLALVRAQKTEAVAVLGSATPSLESFRNVEQGRYQRLLLPTRANPAAAARPLPPVEIIDLRRQPPMADGLFSKPLLQAMQATLAAGEQTILFLNRRGFSPLVLCRDCGHVLRCTQCAVAMTFHQAHDKLACHYCGREEALPRFCPACRSAKLERLGTGTERVETLVRQHFPTARVARLDRDSAGGRGGAVLERVLAQVHAREIDILVGTQMVTKGHDFEGVTLVGVLLPDQGMHMPDFRAAERTFQLLEQVAGRAGRGERPGRVLVQTYNPEHPAVAALPPHDYEGFARAELAQRREAAYPPFSRLIALRLEGADGTEVRAGRQRGGGPGAHRRWRGGPGQGTGRGPHRQASGAAPLAGVAGGDRPGGADGGGAGRGQRGPGRGRASGGRRRPAERALIAAMLASEIDEDLDDTLAAELEEAAQSDDEGPSARLPRSGSLSPGEFAWWLSHLNIAAATGRLWIAGGGLERSLFLDAGRVVLASGNASEDRLGEFLVRQGRLTGEARDRALAEARASGRRLGLVLIQHGRLAGSELGPSLRAHQESLVSSAVAASAGVLGFDPGLTADRRRARLLRHPAALVREGLAAMTEGEALWNRLGGRNGVLHVVSPGHAADVLAAIAGTSSTRTRNVAMSAMSAMSDRQVLALFDGVRSSALVGATCGWPEQLFLALAVTLRAFGLLVPTSARAALLADGQRGRQRDRQLAGERLLARFGLARAGDYFEFLGLAPEASRRDVARAAARVDQELARVEADPEMSATLADEIQLVRAGAPGSGPGAGRRRAPGRLSRRRGRGPSAPGARGVSECASSSSARPSSRFRRCRRWPGPTRSPWCSASPIGRPAGGGRSRRRR